MKGKARKVLRGAEEEEEEEGLHVQWGLHDGECEMNTWNQGGKSDKKKNHSGKRLLQDREYGLNKGTREEEVKEVEGSTPTHCH